MSDVGYELVPADAPEYAMTTEVSDGMFDDILSGLSVGYPPSIRIKSGRFRLVDSAGADTVIPPKDLIEGEFLPVIVLRAKRELVKAYYAKAYDPNQDEAKAPDCFSNDSLKPDASVATPMCANCTTCPMNAFGSGRNQNGEPTAGKACSDTKVLAVLYAKDNSVYSLKVPPASLRALGGYFNELKNRRVAPGNVVTYIGFDTTVDYQALTFRAGKFIPEAMMPTLAERAASTEVEAIVVSRAPAAAPAQIEKPKEVEVEVEPEPEEVQVEIQPEAKPKKAAPKKAAAKKVEPTPEPEAAEEAADGAAMSDDDLSDILGLG